MNNLLKLGQRILKFIYDKKRVRELAFLFLALMIVISIYSIVIVIKDKLWNLELGLFNELAFRKFYSSFKDYKFLYVTTLAVFSAYWTITTYIDALSKSKIKEELEICNSFVIDTIPLATSLVSSFGSKGISSLALFEPIDFTNAEFEKHSEELMKKTIKLLISDVDIKNRTSQVLSHFELFAKKVLEKDIDGKIAFETFGMAYVALVTSLYPSISVTREPNAKPSYFENIVKLYTFWVQKIKEAK